MMKFVSISLPRLALLLSAALLLVQSVTRADEDYPKPSPYPVSWELTFTHAEPKRIVVQAPGDITPNAYWYITYHVANNTDKDKVLFYPRFGLLTDDGRVIKSDHGIAPAVFDAIKKHERIATLQSNDQISGELRQGEDQSRDGVAIWQEPSRRMGTFSIFCAGFWGESATVTVGDQQVTLVKTLQLTYHQSSDANHPGEGDLRLIKQQFVMR